MKQVLIKQGQVIVEEVPAPLVEEGRVIVRVVRSCISVGTELAGISASEKPLYRKALEKPQQVKKAIEMVAAQGISRTWDFINSKINTFSPTGYSAAGVILETGKGMIGLMQGDRVACAGAGLANHAEIVSVPQNLCVKILDELDFDGASTVTLGAIALQGIRRGQPTLGETFVVVGLGVLGQLTVQLLKINGCRVIGTDLSEARIKLALDHGMNVGVLPEEGDDVEQVIRLTNGIGADGVIITASTPSDSVISTAFKMCRKKGRVVLVGDVGLDLNRADFYQKELDFFISTSYGPGRYDNRYEEKGLDYPISYVRWTENRNMAEYLRLLSEGKINISRLVRSVYPIEQAATAYNALKSGDDKPIMVLLSYDESSLKSIPERVIHNSVAQGSGNNRIRIAVVGAGAFARGMHLPNLKLLSDRYHIQAIVSRTGHNAMMVARQFGANYSGTDYMQILKDPEIDAVLIATRHHLHAPMVLQALKAGKHVLVEKPLALSGDELYEIRKFYQTLPSSEAPILLTGFNRRFSRFAKRIYELLQQRSGPMILNYRMNAGYIPLDNWIHTEEGGGRNRGEACHIYDLFTYFTGSKVVEVNVQKITPTGYYSHYDNFIASMKFDDGSLASLTYTALGSKEYPKERLDIFVDGKVFTLDDYRSLTIVGMNAKGLESKSIDKGQKEELEAFASVIQKGGDWAIPLWQQIQATEIALQVEKNF